MGFRKKTKLALKTLFFGLVKGHIDYRIARAESEHDELVDRITSLQTMGEYARQALGMAVDDSMGSPGHPESESDETLH